MNLEKFAQSKPGLVGGVVLLVAAGYQLLTLAEQYWAELPVMVPPRVAAANAASSAGGRVPVVYQVLATPSSKRNASATVEQDPIRMERLFVADAGRPGHGPLPDAALRLPNPADKPDAGSRPPGMPGGIDERDASSLFRVDGISNGGAFITGRYFKTGDVLEGVAFPVPLPQGEKARLQEVSWDSITIMLGKKEVVLTRPKE